MKLIYKIMISLLIAVFAVLIIASPVRVLASADNVQPETPINPDDGVDEELSDAFTDGLPLFPSDVYGHHYVLVSSHTSDISTVTFYLLIFDDISIVTSDYTAEEIASGSEFLLRGINGNCVRYWYQYSFDNGWEQSTRVIDEFKLNPRELRINSVTFDIPLTSDTSVIAIPANEKVTNARNEHIEGFGSLIYGLIDACDANYLGIMPLVCMISGTIIILVHRMVGRGF